MHFVYENYFRDWDVGVKFFVLIIIKNVKTNKNTKNIQKHTFSPDHLALRIFVHHYERLLVLQNLFHFIIHCKTRALNPFRKILLYRHVTACNDNGLKPDVT